MTPVTPPSPAEGPAGAEEPRRTSVGWQLVQVAALAALLVTGMYVVDLDAKALAERRARPALLRAVEEAASRSPENAADPELERAVAVYAEVCAQCAPVERCREAIRSIREAGVVPVGRGPCKTAIFNRGSPEETPMVPRAP